MNEYNSPEYKRSREIYKIQSTVYYFVTLLVTDAFLAKLLGSIGIKDSLIGIISSLASTTFAVQLASIFLVRLRISSKKLIMILDTIGILFFMLLYLAPFIPVGQAVKTILVIVSVIAAYTGNNLIAPILFKWANSFVEPQKRASYSASKEMLSLVSGMVFAAVIGYVIDYYEGLGNLNGAFLFLAVLLLIINICNFICLALIKKEEERTASEQPVSAVVKKLLGNKNFCNVLILAILKSVAVHFSIGFMGTFKTNDLMISVFVVQIINIVANFIRLLVSKPIGRYSDKYSFAKGYRLGLYLTAGAFLIGMFITKATWILIVPYTILYSCSVAGTNQNGYNMIYSYVETEYVAQAMAINSSIGGICGLGASIFAGKIVAYIQANNNLIFGLHLYAQQLLCAISLVILIIAIIFAKKVIEKQQIMIQ